MKIYSLRIIGAILLATFLYVGSYLVFRKTKLGGYVYCATEDVVKGEGTLYRPARIPFENWAEITVAYFYFPLSKIDYRIHGHAWTF